MRTRRHQDIDERYDEENACEEEQQNEQDEWEAGEEEQEDDGKLRPARAPFSQIFGFGAGTLLAAGLLDMAAHLGPTGLVIGGIAAYVASRHGPELYEQVRGMLPPAAPVSAEAACRYRVASREVPMRRSLLDRVLGRFPDEEEDGEWEDEEEDEEERTPALAHHTATREQRPAPAAPSFVPPAVPPFGPVVTLSPSVQVPLRDLAGKAIFICGIRRHGKTTLGALLAEQLGQYYLPLFIPCLEGDYLSLAEVLPRAVIAGHSQAAASYRGVRFAPLDTAQAAYQLGYDLLEYGYQVILDLSSYTVLEEALGIQINVIRGLFHWANTHPERRVPAHVFLDEAQRYLPQNLADSVIGNRATLAALLKCYMDLIAIGGKRGLAPLVLTQRMAQVNKKIMAQSEVFFLLRQTHDGDLERCMEYVSSQIATKEQIARFQPGEGVYLAADGSQCVLTFGRRQSSDRRSATPQAEAAARYARMPLYQPRTPEIPSADHSPRRVTTPPPVALPAVPPPAPLPPLPPRQAGEAGSVQAREREESSVSVLPASDEGKPAPTLKDAIVCWNELITANMRPSRNNLQQALVAKGFDCKENWARKFYDEIKALRERRAASGG